MPDMGCELLDGAEHVMPFRMTSGLSSTAEPTLRGTPITHCAPGGFCSVHKQGSPENPAGSTSISSQLGQTEYFVPKLGVAFHELIPGCGRSVAVFLKRFRCCPKTKREGLLSRCESGFCRDWDHWRLGPSHGQRGGAGSARLLLPGQPHRLAPGPEGASCPHAPGCAQVPRCFCHSTPLRAGAASNSPATTLEGTRFALGPTRLFGTTEPG